MYPRELHRETVRLVKVMQNVRDSEMGISIKKAEIKKLKYELIQKWMKNKDMIPMTNIPSKNIVMNIATGFDKKHNTNYTKQLFKDSDDIEDRETVCSDACSDAYSDAYSEVYSNCLTETSEITV